MIELKSVSKYFPSNNVTALDKAGINLRSSEIHALLGENGTGKSTLMHILAGFIPPSSGSILIDGKEQRFSSPADALAQGIGMVRQHPGIVRRFKVWEDCILGAETPGHSLNLFYNPRAARKRVHELSDYWGFDLPIDNPSESLTVSQRQIAAVLSLLLRDVKWLIFDEPTTVLGPDETKALYELSRRLRSEGRGIILITHKLEEALAISDRITVIRHGVTQESRYTSETSIEDLGYAIFGDNITHGKANETTGSTTGSTIYGGINNNTNEQPVLHIKDLQIESLGMKNINLKLKPGEILGITGEQGLEALEHALVGLPDNPEKDGSPGGSVILNGHDIKGKGVRAFRKAGGAYLSADRLGLNLAPELPLSESLIIHAFRRLKRGPFLDTASLKTWCREILDRAGIRRSASDRVGSFSGGMLQLILLAREFAESASLLILAEAGSGLDKSKRSKLEEELKAHARRGAAALLFSSDAEEFTSLTDKILVLKDGVLLEWGKNEV